jgi:hypothetical protein
LIDIASRMSDSTVKSALFSVGDPCAKRTRAAV